MSVSLNQADNSVWALNASGTLLCLPEPTTLIDVVVSGQVPQFKGDTQTVAWSVMYGQSVLGSYTCAMDVQGNTSTQTTKKNFKFNNFTNANGDSVLIKMADWVENDKIEWKAFGPFPEFGTNYFDGIVLDRTMIRDTLSYRIWSSVRKSHAWPDNLLAPLAVWMTENTDSASLPVSAKFGTDGYPARLTINGEFYGIGIWRGAGDNDDYLINKKNPAHYLVQANQKDQSMWTNWTPGFWDFSAPKKPDTDLFGNFVKYIAACQNGSASLADFDQYSDRKSMLDYLLVIELLASQDSMINNIRFLSWDTGKRWYWFMYDMDETAGIVWGLTPEETAPDVIGWITDYNAAFEMLRKYFTLQLEARWKYLRDTNVISMQSIDGIIRSLTGLMPADVVAQDIAQWGTNSQSTYGYLINWYQGRIAWLDKQWGYSAS